MEEREWKNEFLGRCKYPREVFVDGMRIRITDETHAAYWDENGTRVALGPCDEVHAMELDLLDDADELVDFKDTGDGSDDDKEDDDLGDTGSDATDISGKKRADALELVAATSDVATLQEWLLATRDTQVKGAIKTRLAELG